MRHLTDLLRGDRPAVTLDRAALDIARLEYPDLNPEPWVERLDAIAAEIGRRIGPAAPGEEFVDLANLYLFGELGLRGNERHYYDPRNSCLNDVLDRRLGIPITLSVIYMEVARRLGRTVHGIGLPSHFLVQYDDGRFSTYLDPFHGGEPLTRSECAGMIMRLTGAEPPPSAFVPFTPKQIAIRMLQNLKGVYVANGSYDRALEAIDLIISGGQFTAGEYKQRGVVLLQLRRYRAAMQDLERYLKQAPEASDRSDVVQQIEAIHRYLGALN